MFCLSSTADRRNGFPDLQRPTKSDIVVARPCKMLNTAYTADRHTENQIRHFGLNSHFDALTAKLIKKIKINNDNACTSQLWPLAMTILWLKP